MTKCREKSAISHIEIASWRETVGNAGPMRIVMPQSTSTHQGRAAHAALVRHGAALIEVQDRYSHGTNMDTCAHKY